VVLNLFRSAPAAGLVLLLAACGGSASPASIASSAAPAVGGAASTTGGSSSSVASAKPAGSAGAAASAKPAGSASAAASPAAKPAASGAASPRLGSSQNVVGNAPIWITSKAGIFKQNGLNADLQSVAANLAIKQVVAGQLDGMIGGSPEALSARAAGSKVTIVAVFQNHYDQFLVAPKAVTSVDQLRGKTIGVINKPSVNGVGTVAALKRDGLQVGKDYTLIETGSAGGAYASLFASMSAHKIDAGALPGDLVRKVTANGDFHVLYDMAKRDDLLSAGSTLTLRSEYVDQHPADVQKTLDSLLQGAKYFREHPDEAKALMRESFKITDPTDLDQAYQRQVDLTAKDPTPRPEQYADLVEALGQIEPDVKTLDLKTLLEPKFAQDAIKRGLTG
jgi:ABC-type nitrate/sulfonate/bicarbonate transport system substrate-binding protein